jgi:hypothetical protein
MTNDGWRPLIGALHCMRRSPSPGETMSDALARARYNWPIDRCVALLELLGRASVVMPPSARKALLLWLGGEETLPVSVRNQLANAAALTGLAADTNAN